MLDTVSFLAYDPGVFNGLLGFEQDLIDLRAEANYWKAMHARACERETRWKQRAHELEAALGEREGHLSKLSKENEELKAKLAWLQQQLFGRKSEKKKGSPDSGSSEGSSETSSPPEAGTRKRRKRGKQRGAKGRGRKHHEELETEVITHDLEEGKKCCPTCGKPFLLFPGTEDSQEIHWEVRLVRRIHKRPRYVPDCDCQAVPGIVTAPPPPKVIPKGLFSTGFWVRVVLEKFLFQRPLYRVCKALELEGLSVSQGTLTGGLRRLGELLQPLYAGILQRCRAANHWHMDETRWMVFSEVEGKIGHRWWLWVAVTIDTCVFVLDPTRSANVPKTILGEDPEGIISADRYGVYKSLGGKILVAFCWAHVRRDFLRVGREYGKLKCWADGWVERIRDLYRFNAQRLAAPRNSEEFRREQRKLRESIARMRAAWKRELRDPALHPAARKTLVCLRRHWKGLTIFVDHPQIPMDNNEAERRLRNPVVGRKNYYGSGSVWSGALAAVLFTIIQTALRNNLDPQRYLQAYFEACAQNGGESPRDLGAFLPWNLSEEKRASWRYPKRPP